MEGHQLIEATCPECRGPLTELRRDGVLEFRCLVGHRYSARSLLQAHSETQERMLWAAVVVLEEANNLVSAVADMLAPEELKRLRDQAVVKNSQAQQIRGILEHLEAFQTD